MTTHTSSVALIVVLSGLASSAAYAQLSIDAYVIAGGGSINASGGSLSMSGTIGQPLAGQAASGELTLYSGFWSPVVGPACDPDTNQDGVVDQGDIDYLINVIAGGSNSTQIDPDINRDGVVDQGDVDTLINVVAGGPCP